MDFETLVLVAGHSVPHRFDALDRDEGWYLKHFQSGEGHYYVEHARAGVRVAADDPLALLIFAGGQTDERAGPRSEAQGYWLIADHYGWEGHVEVRARATTEEFSLDSFLNLLYGLCRFREFTGHYPRHVTVVGWAFKGARFDFHRESLRFPRQRYTYVGVNDPEDVANASKFEAMRLEDFRRDPYGRSSELRAKREARNPFHRRHGYVESCPELFDLLKHEGPEMFSGPLPW
ncbi:MAG: hypothetical protein JNL98_35880 [Bryobacterales bacterium]|nr:hypothetical protein [Bryobacterales bacterium]